MRSAFHRTARFVRHLPGLEQAEWLWDALRKPYHWVLDSSGQGVTILVGGSVPVKVPIEFIGGNWEVFETEAVGAFVKWVRNHPAGVVLDVGSSIGLYSAVALFAGTGVEVIAFDSDLPSLAALRRLCQHADRRRLRLVHGLVGEKADQLDTIEKALIVTETELDVIPELSPTRYICLEPGGCSPDEVAIPCRRLDDLFPSDGSGKREMLIKCDVEGAELHILRGAEKLIGCHRPDLLLSVHPETLPYYGHSKQMVSDYLRRSGYEVDCLAVDHEEHWWCTCKSP